MKFLNTLERKLGRYAIPNLPAVMIGLYAAGYLIYMMMPEMLDYLVLRPDMILRGEVWRLITWILVPPYRPDLFTIIMLYFYFSIGKTLERVWGSFRFNLYIISGLIFTIIGSFLLFLFANRIGYFSTYYINMSIFLALAMTYPDIEVMLYFLIPVKMKWMAVLYLALFVFSMVEGGWGDRVALICSLLNFFIFYLMSRKNTIRRYTPHEIHRRTEFKRAVEKAAPSEKKTRHKCAVCGRTEEDGDHLEFRFCSKCDGNHEYCQDHLFTHTHIKL